jgi:uncharacterized protein
MSEFSTSKEKRVAKLLEVSRLVLKTGNARFFVDENPGFIQTVIPSDFIILFDELIKEGYPLDELKTCSNKILNIFHIPVENYHRIEPEPGSFLYVLEQNNREMEQVLNKIKPVFKLFGKNTNDSSLKNELILLFEKLEVFVNHYAIKENVLFPVIEKTWPDYRCLQIMWSFHDDIRRNIQYILNKLRSNISDVKEFNRKVGDVFFNMLAIKFREEKILFPTILSTISTSQLEEMNREGFEIGYPYIQPEKPELQTAKPTGENGLADLGTGFLTVEQVKLIFNHLPVDITFVDENNQVRYFSTPEKRIFPRTNAVIGREVKNCHPPESVHVVEKIVESFRSGEKNKADFWIKKKGEYVLIQYFAVRDENGNYRGVIEVSQEISDIKAIEGEKRLLDW